MIPIHVISWTGASIYLEIQHSFETQTQPQLNIQWFTTKNAIFYVIFSCLVNALIFYYYDPMSFQ